MRLALQAGDCTEQKEWMRWRRGSSCLACHAMPYHQPCHTTNHAIPPIRGMGSFYRQLYSVINNSSDWRVCYIYCRTFQTVRLKYDKTDSKPSLHCSHQFCLNVALRSYSSKVGIRRIIRNGSVKFLIVLSYFPSGWFPSLAQLWIKH